MIKVHQVLIRLELLFSSLHDQLELYYNIAKNTVERFIKVNTEVPPEEPITRIEVEKGIHKKIIGQAKEAFSRRIKDAKSQSTGGGRLAKINLSFSKFPDHPTDRQLKEILFSDKLFAGTQEQCSNTTTTMLMVLHFIRAFVRPILSSNFPKKLNFILTRSV